MKVTRLHLLWFPPQDLTHLNRPLNRVIIVDTDKSSVSHQENSIILDEWKGDIDDKILWDLIPFLQSMKIHNGSISIAWCVRYMLESELIMYTCTI